MNWKGSASSLVTKSCIRIERVSAAEYFQGAFGQKAARSAIEPQWLFRLVRIGRSPPDRRPHPLIHGAGGGELFARTAPTNQYEGAALRRVGGSSQGALPERSTHTRRTCGIFFNHPLDAARKELS